MTRIANEVRRDVAKILGSSTGASDFPPLCVNTHREKKNDSAFIVIIVVLVVIIIVSCSAIVYLLTGDRRVESQEGRRRQRYNAQPLVDRDLSDPQQSRKWYSYLWGSRDRHNHTRLDEPATMIGRSEEGRIQANGRESWEWDVDFSENHALRSTEGDQSGLPGMSEHESSASSFVGPRVYTHPSRMHSHTSDGASSVLRYDPHDVRGLPYPIQFPMLPQVTVPSIQSQSHSPTTSSRSSPVPRQIMKSPEPISNTPSQDSGHADSVRDSLPQFAPPVLRTAGSGTKFFESL